MAAGGGTMGYDGRGEGGGAVVWGRREGRQQATHARGPHRGMAREGGRRVGMGARSEARRVKKREKIL